MFVIKDKTNNKFLYQGNLLPKLENSVNQTVSGRKALDAAQGKVLNDKIDSVKSELDCDIANRVAKQQSVTDSGKYLKIGEDGIVVPAEVSGGSTDVQINGTSITSDGIANIPIAEDTLGVVKINNAHGFMSLNGQNGYLTPFNAKETDFINRTNVYRQVSPVNFDLAVKHALCDAIGTANPDYTDEEKASARARLGALNSKWELVCSENSIEEVHNYIVNFTNPRKIYEIFACVIVPIATSMSPIYLRIGDNENSYNVAYGNGNFMSNTQVRTLQFSANIGNGFSDSISSYGSNNQASSGINKSCYINNGLGNDKDYTNIEFYCSTANVNFPTGTSIKIWVR